MNKSTALVLAGCAAALFVGLSFTPSALAAPINVSLSPGADGFWSLGVWDRGSTTTKGPKGDMGLAGFWLDWKTSGSDHELKRAGVLHDPIGQTRVFFSDDDGKELFRSQVQFQALPAGTRVLAASRRQCRGTCAVRIAAPAPGEVFVLRGFLVERTGGDTHLRELTIRPRPGDRAVDVTFADNGSPEFHVELLYAYVPKAWVAATRSAKLDKRRSGSFLHFADTTDRRRVLQGFSMKFNNGDHHVRKLQISTVQTGWGGYLADKDGHDPFQLSVQWASLRAKPFHQSDKTLPATKPVGGGLRPNW